LGEETRRYNRRTFSVTLLSSVQRAGSEEVPTTRNGSVFFRHEGILVILGSRSVVLVPVLNLECLIVLSTVALLFVIVIGNETPFASSRKGASSFFLGRRVDGRSVILFGRVSLMFDLRGLFPCTVEDGRRSRGESKMEGEDEAQVERKRKGERRSGYAFCT
jgi:hypothetical protein